MAGREKNLLLSPVRTFVVTTSIEKRNVSRVFWLLAPSAVNLSEVETLKGTSQPICYVRKFIYSSRTRDVPTNNYGG